MHKFKQWGGKNKKAAGKLLQGKIYQQTPFNFNRKESA
jgi:protein gp37